MAKLSKKDKNTLKRHTYLLKTISSVGKKRRDTVLSNAPPSLFPTIKMLAKHLTIYNARSYIYIGIFVFPFAFLDTTFCSRNRGFCLREENLCVTPVSHSNYFPR